MFTKVCTAIYYYRRRTVSIGRLASRARVRIVARRARHFFLSADARIGNTSNRRKGLTQVVRETRIYQGISEPARKVLCITHIAGKNTPCS